MTEAVGQDTARPVPCGSSAGEATRSPTPAGPGLAIGKLGSGWAVKITTPKVVLVHTRALQKTYGMYRKWVLGWLDIWADMPVSQDRQRSMGRYW